MRLDLDLLEKERVEGQGDTSVRRPPIMERLSNRFGARRL